MISIPVVTTIWKNILVRHIKEYIKQGDGSQIMSRIDNGTIKATKSLADSLKSIIEGNKEFIIRDDQKVIYGAALPVPPIP